MHCISSYFNKERRQPQLRDELSVLGPCQPVTLIDCGNLHALHDAR